MNSTNGAAEVHGIDDGPEESGVRGRRSSKPSQADLLVQLVLTMSTLFCDSAETAYIEIDTSPGRDVLRLQSEGFARWAAKTFHDTMGKVPNRGAITDAARVLAGVARDEPRREVFVRVAAIGDRIYLDLANEERQVVTITTAGWTISDADRVCFVRPKGLLPLPTPVRGGSVSQLKELVNVDETQFVLLISWLIGALRGQGPYPILAFVAEQNAAKTTAARIAREIVDPNHCPIRSAPREERDLAVTASNGHVLMIDNLSLSGCPQWLSDALCRVATGGGLVTRKLFTDDDETLFTFSRPVILTSIDEIAERADLGDRCLTLHLHPIPVAARRQEREVLAEFRRRLPRILGALLDAVSGALARRDAVHLDDAPRLVDFATFATAAEHALGWEDGTVINAYRANQETVTLAALDSDPVASAVRGMMEKRSQWHGTATDLLQVLVNFVPEEVCRSKRWPLAPNNLTNRLRRATPALRAVGIIVEEHRTAASRGLSIRTGAIDSADHTPIGQDSGGVRS
jgi:hypothetical protein